MTGVQTCALPILQGTKEKGIDDYTGCYTADYEDFSDTEYLYGVKFFLVSRNLWITNLLSLQSCILLQLYVLTAVQATKQLWDMSANVRIVETSIIYNNKNHVTVHT